jgi:hypothetical protein
MAYDKPKPSVHTAAFSSVKEKEIIENKRRIKEKEGEHKMSSAIPSDSALTKPQGKML